MVWADETRRRLTYLAKRVNSVSIKEIERFFDPIAPSNRRKFQYHFEWDLVAGFYREGKTNSVHFVAPNQLILDYTVRSGFHFLVSVSSAILQFDGQWAIFGVFE